MEVVSKQDEWSKLDFLLATRLLNKSGYTIDQSKIQELKSERLTELAKPEKAPVALIYFGYIFAILGGAVGIFIGWHLFTAKKTLPNGEKVLGFINSDREHGNRILLIGIFSLLVAIVVNFILGY